MFKQKRSPIDTFLSSLNYWQRLNLGSVLKVGQENTTLKQARSDLLPISDNEQKIKFLLEQAINSPNPKI